MSIVCPNCRSLQSDDSPVCSNCQQQLPERSEDGPTASPPPAISLKLPREVPAILQWSDQKMARTAAGAGVGLGVLFSVAAFTLSPEKSLLASMFDLRSFAGLVPVSIAVMFFWGAMLCWLRWRRLKVLRAISDRSLLADATRQLGAPGPEAMQRVEAFAAYLDRDSCAHSPLLRRLHAILRQWRLLPGLSEADIVLAQHRAQDEEGVRHGYQLIRAFVWAMPVVGLMGTVIGISLAVGGFAQFLAGGVDEVSAIKQSLVGVTNGLSFAFLITLEGLLGALLLMLPATALQAREEKFLVSLEHRVAETFLPELQRVAPAVDTVEVTGPEPVSPSWELEEILRRVLSELPALQLWQDQMVRLTEESVAAVERSASEAGERVLAAIGRANDDVATSLRAVLQVQEKLVDRTAAEAQRSQAETQRLIEDAAERFGAAAEQVVERFERLHTIEVATLDGVARDLESRNRELAASLADHQVGFRETVEHWKAEGPRVDAYFEALRQLGQELDRAMQIQRELQRQVADLNANGTLIHALDHVNQTIASLQPFLKRLTGTFHFVAAAEPVPRAMFGGDGR